MSRTATILFSIALALVTPIGFAQESILGTAYPIARWSQPDLEARIDSNSQELTGLMMRSGYGTSYIIELWRRTPGWVRKLPIDDLERADRVAAEAEVLEDLESNRKNHAELGLQIKDLSATIQRLEGDGVKDNLIEQQRKRLTELTKRWHNHENIVLAERIGQNPKDAGMTTLRRVRSNPYLDLCFFSTSARGESTKPMGKYLSIIASQATEMIRYYSELEPVWPESHRPYFEARRAFGSEILRLAQNGDIAGIDRLREQHVQELIGRLLSPHVAAPAPGPIPARKQTAASVTASAPVGPAQVPVEPAQADIIIPDITLAPCAAGTHMVFDVEELSDDVVVRHAQDCAKEMAAMNMADLTSSTQIFEAERLWEQNEIANTLHRLIMNYRSMRKSITDQQQKIAAREADGVAVHPGLKTRLDEMLATLAENRFVLYTAPLNNTGCRHPIVDSPGASIRAFKGLVIPRSQGSLYRSPRISNAVAWRTKAEKLAELWDKNHQSGNSRDQIFAEWCKLECSFASDMAAKLDQLKTLGDQGGNTEALARSIENTLWDRSKDLLVGFPGLRVVQR